MSVLVLGIGNVLMKDDSIGVRAVDELQRRFRFSDDVEILDGGTSGIELLSYICNRDCMIIVDAVKSGLKPGTVVRVEGEDVPAKFMTRISPHQLGLSDLLAAATLTGELPREMVLFGIEPKLIELGFEVSEEVEAGFERLIEVIVEELRRVGCAVNSVEPPSGRKSIWENVTLD